MNAPRRHQRGVALLVALLVVALATILIAALLDRGELVLARTRNTLRGEQAEAYAQGLEAYAAKVLLDIPAGQADTNTSPWAMPLPPQPVPGGTIGATMRDQNGCFNLNNLASKNAAEREEWIGIFRRLLTAVGLQADLVGAVRGWLDPDLRATETGIYLAQPVPYRPRGGLFAHVSELRLVRGFGGDAYARLAPYVCALPPGTKLNVNTAPVPVLMSLGDGMTRATAEKLWSRGQARYADVNTFLHDAGIPVTADLYHRLGVSSTYFLARSDILLDGVPFTFYSLIERNGLRVLQRSRGADLALVAPAPIAAGEAP
ncbi:type II secretion system minor pseudopilin GspK [Dokdonella sp.]|uniref:type II secretion system minor pseudopilin GspK n=1 Tax=Dokdonella sp. TaxID=2291710 RepID=UPI001B038A08|nr:type II secretion system minor pseudopilin GspK [Dokdonella sp.]MBO9663877.1 type II secretion system minor pseudopilin GspK [Dokdonella sp.]